MPELNDTQLSSEKTIYKTISQSESQNRPMNSLTEKQRSQAKTIVSNFIRYMIEANT